MPGAEDRAPAMLLGPHAEWYHGSPLHLETLQKGSTVTPVIVLAEAFSHKPRTVSITIRGGDAAPRVTIEHDGREHGYLYRVLVEDPARDLVPHPRSTCAPGEEVLTTRDLLLQFIREVPVDDEKWAG
jgi:hypothetical protein